MSILNKQFWCSIVRYLLLNVFRVNFDLYNVILLLSRNFELKFISGTLLRSGSLCANNFIFLDFLTYVKSSYFYNLFLKETLFFYRVTELILYNYFELFFM